MADLYLKSLESERRQLWATCRLKGLAAGTPERQRIAALDEAIAAHKAQAGAKSGAKAPAQARAKPKPKPKPKPKAKPKPGAGPAAGAKGATPRG